MTLRARIFIIVSLIVLFVLGVSLLLIINSKNKKEQAVNTNQTIVVDQNNISQVATGAVNGALSGAATGLTVQPQTTEEAVKNGVRQLAKIFVERYNSYSTDSNYQNIVEIQSLVTENLWKKLSAKIGTAQTAKEFVGVTTQSVSADLVAWTDASAQVEVKTLRIETKGTATTNTYKNYLVYMVKSGNNWLVEKFDIK